MKALATNPLFTVILACSVVVPVQAQSPDKGAYEIDPMPAVQSEIERIVVTGSKGELDKPGVVDALHELLKRIRNDLGSDAEDSEVRKELIRQAAYSAGHVDREMWGMLIQVFLGRFMNPPHDEVVEALLPHLASSDDKTVRGARSLLEPFLSLSFDLSGTRAMKHVRKWIKQHGTEHAAFRPLLKLLYEWQEPSAVIALLPDNGELSWEIHVIKTAAWRERHGFLGRGKSKPQAVKALAKLVRDERWWVRLYVVHLFKNWGKGFINNSVFMNEHLTKTLMGDEDPAVKSAASELL